MLKPQMFMPMQIIWGGKKLIAQLNEKWNSNFLGEFENNILQPLGPPKQSHMKILREHLLFCISNEEKECSELIPSAVLPKGGTLIMVNVSG